MGKERMHHLGNLFFGIALNSFPPPPPPHTHAPSMVMSFLLLAPSHSSQCLFLNHSFRYYLFPTQG